MSSFEPAELLLDTQFVPDPADGDAPGFEGADAGAAEEEVNEVERSWLRGYAAGRDAEREALARLAHELAALAPLIDAAESGADPTERVRFRYDWLRRDIARVRGAKPYFREKTLEKVKAAITEDDRLGSAS